MAIFTLLLTPVLQAKAIIKVFVEKKKFASEKLSPLAKWKKTRNVKIYELFSPHPHQRLLYFSKETYRYFITYAVCMNSTCSYCCYNKYTAFEAWI